MGYRIELGEIETTLNSFPAIQEVALLLRPGAGPHPLRLHRHPGHARPSPKQARASLPRYMVPNLYHQVETMPHNPNGKT